MRAKSTTVEIKFKAFSETTRLRILYLLLKGEMCVCDIVAIVGVPQPTASRHLAYLRRSGLVRAQKRGFWTYYTLAPPQSAFHRNLLNCLKTCSDEVASIRKDAERQRKSMANCC
jgi:ArsR family transcriptional regulator, arsenate/arsenite/antimonite-responsive transcriptional repressor